MNLAQVSLGPLTGLAGDNQAIVRMGDRDLQKCIDQIFKTLVRPDASEEQGRPLTLLKAQLPLRVPRSKSCVRNRVVDSERDDADNFFGNPEITE